jgi:hypothetical protein
VGNDLAAVCFRLGYVFAPVDAQINAQIFARVKSFLRNYLRRIIGPPAQKRPATHKSLQATASTSVKFQHQQDFAEWAVSTRHACCG